MSLLYTEEQKALLALVREMAENEIKPHVKDADEKGECPRELFKWGFDMGLHMLEIPEEYGGTGLSYETTAMIFEELAKVDAGYAITFVTTFVALRNVILAGTKEQGQYFADKIAPGGFAGFALTEPNAGSDPAAMRATAVKDGDEYILNGTKTFITNGAWRMSSWDSLRRIRRGDTEAYLLSSLMRMRRALPWEPMRTRWVSGFPTPRI